MKSSFIKTFFFILTLISLMYKAYAQVILNRPRLPVGEYKLKFKAVFICNDTADYLISFNWHLHKTSPTETEIRGKMSLKVPLDDSYMLHVNMAVWSKIGGWKDNAFIYSSKNGCSTFKFFVGRALPSFMKSLNLNATHPCPVGQGEYVMQGFNVKEIDNSNLPKKFFYGLYKFRLYFTDNTGKIIGCLTSIVDVVRPWE